MLAFLSLTTPLLLAGLTLLSLPVLAHLIQRHSQRRIVFPSIALLLQTVATQSRFHRLRRWLLLVLRLLAIACIVLAFTRPVWLEAQVGEDDDPSAHVALVIVLDVSASTGQTDGGVRLLDSMKATVGRSLDSLSPGEDVAGIVITDGSPRSLFPKLSSNITGLRGELRDLKPLPQQANFSAAIQAAGRLLDGHRGKKRVVIVSDLQRDNWLGFLTDTTQETGLPPGCVVSVAPLEGVAPDNIALASPRHFPAQPLLGEPVDLTVQATNHSDTVREVTVAMKREQSESGEHIPAEQTTLRLAARERRDVTFRIDDFNKDQTLVTFSLMQPDGLPLDDRAYLVAQTASRVPILVIADDDPDRPGDSAYYLTRGLMPGRDQVGRFEVRHRRASSLSAKDLSSTAGVVIGYLGAMTDETTAMLTDYVQQGGGILFFSGEGPVDRNLRKLNTSANGDLLPWEPGRRESTLTGGEPRRIKGGRWQSRWLKQFDEQSQLAIEEIWLGRTWSAGAVTADAELLLSFDDQGPAVGVRTFGKGMFVLSNFSPEVTTGDLARHGAFVPLLQMLVQGLTPKGEAKPPTLVGMPIQATLTLPFEAASRLTAAAPDGTPIPLRTSIDGEQVAITVPDTAALGHYRILDGTSTVEVAGVNLDQREGDLRRVTAAEIEQRFSESGAAVQHLGGSGAMGSTWDGSLPLRGSQLWGEFLTVALICFGMELFLLGLWRR